MASLEDTDWNPLGAPTESPARPPPRPAPAPLRPSSAMSSNPQSENFKFSYISDPDSSSSQPARPSPSHAAPSHRPSPISTFTPSHQTSNIAVNHNAPSKYSVPSTSAKPAAPSQSYSSPAPVLGATHIPFSVQSEDWDLSSSEEDPFGVSEATQVITVSPNRDARTMEEDYPAPDEEKIDKMYYLH